MGAGGAISLAGAALAIAALALLAAKVLVAGSEGDHRRPTDCAGTLLSLSPCLSFLAAPPNNLSSSPSSFCCDPVGAAMNSGTGANSGAACLCHIFLHSSILGFPLNSSRLLSLVSLCGNNSTANISLPSLCQGLQSLPPLYSPTTGYGLPKPLSSDSGSSSPPHPENSPESAVNSSGLPHVWYNGCRNPARKWPVLLKTSLLVWIFTATITLFSVC